MSICTISLSLAGSRASGGRTLKCTNSVQSSLGTVEDNISLTNIIAETCSGAATPLPPQPPNPSASFLTAAIYNSLATDLIPSISAILAGRSPRWVRSGAFVVYLTMVLATQVSEVLGEFLRYEDLGNKVSHKLLIGGNSVDEDYDGACGYSWEIEGFG